LESLSSPCNSPADFPTPAGHRTVPARPENRSRHFLSECQKIGYPFNSAVEASAPSGETRPSAQKLAEGAIFVFPRHKPLKSPKTDERILGKT
jgi:hypothetical protein